MFTYYTGYSSLPLFTGDTFKDPHWVTETTDSTEPYICYVFFLYIYTYDKNLIHKLGTVEG